MKRYLIYSLVLGLILTAEVIETHAHEKHEFYPQLVLCRRSSTDLNRLVKSPLGKLRVAQDETGSKILVGTKEFCRSTISSPSAAMYGSFYSICTTVTSTCSPHDLGDRFDEVLQEVHEQERIATEQAAEQNRKAEEIKKAKKKDHSWFNRSKPQHNNQQNREDNDLVPLNNDDNT